MKTVESTNLEDATTSTRDNYKLDISDMMANSEGQSTEATGMKNLGHNASDSHCIEPMTPNHLDKSGSESKASDDKASDKVICKASDKVSDKSIEDNARYEQSTAEEVEDIEASSTSQVMSEVDKIFGDSDGYGFSSRSTEIKMQELSTRGKLGRVSERDGLGFYRYQGTESESPFRRENLELQHILVGDDTARQEDRQPSETQAQWNKEGQRREQNKQPNAAGEVIDLEGQQVAKKVPALCRL